jgi:hypothetical protein
VKRLFGDLDDLTLIVQLESHRRPGRTTTPPTKPQPAHGSPISPSPSTRPYSNLRRDPYPAALSTFSGHPPPSTYRCLFPQPCLRTQHTSSQKNASNAKTHRPRVTNDGSPTPIAYRSSHITVLTQDCSRRQSCSTRVPGLARILLLPRPLRQAIVFFRQDQRTNPTSCRTCTTI